MNDRRRVNITRVIDGDTVEIQTKPSLLRKSQKDRIRLYGIDAPESAQKGGTESTKHLSKIIGSGRNVWLETSGTDQYGRSIGILYHRHGNPSYSYNYQMVEAGHAHCYLLSATDCAHYRKAQQHAVSRRLGLWKESNPTPPWDWRKANTPKPSTFPWKWILILAAAALVILALLDLDLPSIDVPSIDLPSLKVPSIDVPSLEIPSIQVPSMDLPSPSLPSIETPALLK